MSYTKQQKFEKLISRVNEVYNCMKSLGNDTEYRLIYLIDFSIMSTVKNIVGSGDFESFSHYELDYLNSITENLEILYGSWGVKNDDGN